MNQFNLLNSPLLLPALAVALGIVLGDRWPLSAWWWTLAAGGLVAGAWLHRPWWVQTAAVFVVALAVGGLRATSVRVAHDQVAWPAGEVDFEAVVVSEVSEKARTMGMDIVVIGGGHYLKCYVAKDDRSRHLEIGDRLLIHSRIEPNSQWRKDTFDYQRYLEVHGFTGQTFVRSSHWQGAGRSWQGLTAWQRLRLHFLSWRHHLLARYREAGADEGQYAVLAAMTLGDKTALTHELRDIYALSGASHVLALSGLHIGILYMVFTLLVVGRRLRLVMQLIAVFAIWAFALLVGLPSSVVRASTMVTTYALVTMTGRSRASVNALALSALLILVAAPLSLFDVGFQLSFAAMLAILALQPLSERIVSREWLLEHRFTRWLWGLTTVSVAAQVGTAPLVAYYFGRLPVYFLLTNLVVIPAASAILYLAPVVLLVPAAGGVLLLVVGVLNRLLTLIATRLPCPSIEGLSPTPVQTAMVYVVLISAYIIIIRYDKHV